MYMDTIPEIKELIEELGRADIIITAMLNVMTFDQKRLVAEQLLSSGVSPSGMTRANEREAILKKYSS
jgi:hypothetical protein